MREQIARHVPPRASRTTTSYPAQQDIEEDDSYYPHRPPSSARRYVTTNGQQVIQQGNRRIVIHDEPPPKRNIHWSLLIVLGMLAMIGLWLGASELAYLWSNHQMDTTYGFPRTYQVDEVVGHGDSSDHPSHFIFENLKGHVIIIEMPGGNVQHARIYSGPTLYSDNAGLIPVTAEFADVNGDGKIDMVLHIQDQLLVFLNDGMQFKPQQ